MSGLTAKAWGRSAARCRSDSISYGSDLTMDYTWEDRRVSVEAHKITRRLWITTSIDVLLDGKRILRTGGKPQLTGTCSEVFVEGDDKHTVEVSWGSSVWGASFPFTLRID